MCLIAGLTLIVSCRSGRLGPPGRSVRQAWNGEKPSLRVSEQPSPLRAEREIPVLSAPEVFAVYVPSHLDRKRDLLIGEHWVYFKLRDGDWFVERERDPEPPAAEKAPEAALVPLKSLEGSDQAVVPWK
ncbi:MAG: hypothetical protein HY716_17525 [Planctomycetes bacterium]|nr:hypothetical protein [Planctomycetota bacterium]